jgi:glycine betaine/proline transport system substrate-binding protein
VLIAVLATMSLGLIGCTTDDADTGDDGDAMEEKGTIRIGWMPWDEDVAVTFLWKALLEEQGYTVELTQADAALIYAGVAAGDLDLFFDAWLPVTHEDYMAEYGDDIEDIGIWYDNAKLTWAVPEYVDATSIADLAGMADTFDSRIIGIEPSAGLMRISINDVVPGYGLDDYTVVEGSTPAMLAELERATNDEEPIVVTLWRPHWAYGVYPIRDLEDPEGILGDAEEIHTLGTAGFSDEFSEVAAWIDNFTMGDDALASLEDLIINQYGEGEEEDAVAEWLSDADNRALADSWVD